MILFVTGTDTGVGKTYFTCAAVEFLRKNQKDVLGFKPVETGCSHRCRDAYLIGKSSGLEVPPVFCFKTPVAPAVASEIEGISISKEKLIREISELADKFEILFVEGAGGLMVPITWDFNYLDLAKAISAEVVVVALNRLGVINHTLLTVKMCELSGVKVRGVVLNSFKDFDESFKTNFDSLSRLLDVPVSPFFSKADISKVLKDFSIS